jgi:hypothetical protein
MSPQGSSSRPRFAQSLASPYEPSSAGDFSCRSATIASVVIIKLLIDAAWLPYVEIVRVLIDLQPRQVSRQTAIELNPCFRLRRALERALGSDDDTTLAQRDTELSIPLNEDVVDWLGHGLDVVSHSSICIPSETSRQDGGAYRVAG